MKKNPIEKNSSEKEALLEQLELKLSEVGPEEASEILESTPEEIVVELLQEINPHSAQDIIEHFDSERKEEIMAAAPADVREQWKENQTFEEGTIGRLMEIPSAVFKPTDTIGETIEALRSIVKTAHVTYGFVTDPNGKLLGVVVMRDLLFAEKQQQLQDIMIRNPFFLKPEMELSDAMKQVVTRHFPVYPVCDDHGVLLGIVRGQMIFEEQAFEISAQPGSMVGVEKEERLSTPWLRSFKSRHPWLQLNLLTAFIAGAVVSLFQDTIDKLVILAVFLPVLAGQSGNTGCQALAVALRGLTLGDLKPGSEKKLVFKEALLGLLNGSLVGVTAGIGMFILASMQKHPSPLTLSLIVLVAMVGSCLASGISGALVPLTLKKLGADPATASSIFLTTATDVVSMGMLLGLGSLIV